ncbi:MAG: flagellar biosynthesis protein FlhB [Deltaproteobacteria bacterium]|nr:flagellar biosynthesis protein FlhB [Deltaproteobacteria bacterium]
MADHDQEKTEQPTSRKLEKAREEGQVAQSQEIPTAMVLAASLAVFVYAGGWMGLRLQDLLRRCFRDVASTDLRAETLLGTMIPFLQDAVIAILPLILAVLVFGTLAYVGQFGFVVSTKAITPDTKKIDPIAGFKRLFSVRSLFEAVKGLAKVGVIAAIVYAGIRGQMDAILGLAGLTPFQIVGELVAIAQSLTLRVVVALVLIAVIDYVYQRQHFMNKQKMTKQEVKDEFKNTEGDPKVKSRIRRIQMELAQKRMMQEVPKADVVITNPTHLAVALRYDRDKDDAPVVVAKGAGFVAQRIREKAREAGVPIIERREIARELYKRCKLGALIPAHLYQAVAEILAYIYSRKAKGHAA